MSTSDTSGSVDADNESSEAGIAWQEARRLLLDNETPAAVALLEAHRDSGNPSILIELAAIEADRSNPEAAKELLEAAGIDTTVDLDAEFDPLGSGDAPGTIDLGRIVAEEIAPFAEIRPKPMAGRNDRCPCGSGKKYKHCHLGNELHSIEHRAGWLYLKMLRYAQVTRPGAIDSVSAALLEGVESEELVEALNSSMIPADLALHEGGIAESFLAAKSTLLPADEITMLQSWIAAERSVHEVTRSNINSMDLTDVATRVRRTVLGTASENPAPVGVLMCGRLLPVADHFQAYGGFLPTDPDLADGLVQACDTGDLDTVVIAMAQIFDAAAEVDDYQGLVGMQDLSALGSFDGAPEDRAERAAQAAIDALNG